MQEDDFLNQYQKDWMQEAETLDQAIDIPLTTLHQAIRNRRQRRIIIWSAAACLAIVFGTGLLLHPSTVATVAAPTTLLANTDIPQQSEAAAASPTAEPLCSSSKIPSASALDDDNLESPCEEQSEPAESEVAIEIPTPDYIETNSLAATTSQPPAITAIETQSLVRITAAPRSRPTFHSSVIEPLLALATNDLD